MSFGNMNRHAEDGESFDIGIVMRTQKILGKRVRLCS